MVAGDFESLGGPTLPSCFSYPLESARRADEPAGTVRTSSAEATHACLAQGTTDPPPRAGTLNTYPKNDPVPLLAAIVPRYFGLCSAITCKAAVTALPRVTLWPMAASVISRAAMQPRVSYWST